MIANTSRRRFLLGLAAAGAAASATKAGPLIDTHLHLFAEDRERFPLHPNAPYDPEARDLESYNAFVQKASIDHAVIVHPEPYQDDHSYLEYCFENEPSPGFFKGTCLFDPIASDIQQRMQQLVEAHPGRIKALRSHAMGDRGAAPSTSGAIKNRDLRDPRVAETWRAATELGLAIQMHFKPFFAPDIAALLSEIPDATVILDHLGRSGMGTAEDYEDVLALARFPNVYMKLSGVGYSSKQEHPYLDAKPVVQKAFDRFGPERMMWGGLGYSEAELERSLEMFETLLDFASEADKAKIRGLTAQRLFGFE